MGEQIKDIDFGRRAAKYDTFAGRASRRFYDLLLGQVRLFPGATVLDAGCGTGTVLRRMADGCETGGMEIKGYGIDITENMLAEARVKCPRMNFYRASCDSTPFENQSIDIIVSCMAFHHFNNKEGFAKEAARLLKPGGMLYIADPRYPEIIRKAINRIFRMIRVAGEFLTPAEAAALFVRHGFESAGIANHGYAQVFIMRRIDAE
jgi:ubiquinone/menaquinone biosynthesis C-methylase UbiE